MPHKSPSRKAEYQAKAHKDRRQCRQNKGLCNNCGGPKENTKFLRCEECRKSDREWKLKRKSSGLCSTCGVSPARQGKAQCEKCSINSRIQKLGLNAQEWIFAKHAWAVFDGKCYSCGSTSPRSTHDWATDHDHKTMKFRGILCHPCNLVLGHVGDDVDKLKKLVGYLEDYETRIKERDYKYKKATWAGGNS